MFKIFSHQGNAISSDITISPYPHLKGQHQENKNIASYTLSEILGEGMFAHYWRGM